jgi:hypothetical protein
MAANIAFTQALQRCGFNAETAATIVNEGFADMETLTGVEDADIDGMIKNVRESRRMIGAGGAGVGVNITFPFLAIQKLKAMRAWAAESVRTGCPLNPGLFTGNVMMDAMSCMTLELLRAEQDEETLTKPKELKDLAGWDQFWEQWKTFCGRMRGAAKCPMTYIFRDHDDVTPAMQNDVYIDHDARLIATTLLQGPYYELDNQRIYDEFKALVLKGPGWSFIKQYDRIKDGRSAVLSLRRQCEGTSAIQSRKAAAYAKIAVAKYNGQKRNYSFDQYVETHQEAYNTLADLDETVPETKKVTDFLAGISDPRLSNAKDLILADISKLQSFELSQQFLKTLVFNKATQEKHERQISGLQVQGGGGNPKNGKRKGGTPKGKKKLQDLAARNYSKEEWFKLSAEQRERIKDLRTAKKQKADSEARNTSSVNQGQPAPAGDGNGGGSKDDFIKQLSEKIATDMNAKGIQFTEP